MDTAFHWEEETANDNYSSDTAEPYTKSDVGIYITCEMKLLETVDITNLTTS